MARQLSFDLPARTALGRDAFFVSSANAAAVADIDATAGWPGGKLVLTGPAGSGKTHLVHVWAAQEGARVVKAADLREQDVPELARGPVAVEDIPRISGDKAPQTALFHLHNLVLADRHALLMTGRPAPGRWGLTLPDLQSRVGGTHHTRLGPPDDILLAAVLAKLFADRQVTPRADVIPYLVQRMERSFEAALQIVDRLDRASLEEGRTLTRPLAARLIAEPGGAG